MPEFDGQCYLRIAVAGLGATIVYFALGFLVFALSPSQTFLDRVPD